MFFFLCFFFSLYISAALKKKAVSTFRVAKFPIDKIFIFETSCGYFFLQFSESNDKFRTKSYEYWEETYAQVFRKLVEDGLHYVGLEKSLLSLHGLIVTGLYITD